MLARIKRIEAESRAAFTLIELLMVIGIIIFLMIILVVVIRQPVDVPARVLIKELASELDAYYAVYKAYPPARMGGGYPNAPTVKASGATSLYYFLMGPREKGWGPAPADGGVSPAFIRPPAAIRSGLVGGPTGGRYFSDDPSGDRPVLYYRANTSPLPTGAPRVLYSVIYDNSENNNFKSWTSGTGPADWQNMIVNPRSKNKAPFNPTSYILVAAGEDRRYGTVVETVGIPGKCDDITNLQ